MNFENFGPEWSLPSSQSSPTKVKGQKEQVNVCATSIENVFTKVKK